MIWSFIQKTPSYTWFRIGVKQAVLFSRAKKNMKECRMGGELSTQTH